MHLILHLGMILLLVCSIFFLVILLLFNCILVIFGEDVAFGGVFRCTAELRPKYGKIKFKKREYVVCFLN